jgi:putative glutamine amidotransferase
LRKPREVCKSGFEALPYLLPDFHVASSKTATRTKSWNAMNGKPKIAVIMDENTSTGGDRYDISKSYFRAISRAGAFAFGIPYAPDMVGRIIEEFDGFLSVGGRINFPREWYVEGDQSQYPVSDRLDAEVELMKGFLERDKPVLGICNGMQMLACLNGCRMVSDVHSSWPGALEHDHGDMVHDVEIARGTRMADIFKAETFSVNSFHREAIVAVSNAVVVTARGTDGVVEAVEVPSYSFAMGLQWHPERLVAESHPGARIFDAFVKAASI